MSQEGPQLHSFQPATTVVSNQNDTIIEEDTNSTIPEDIDTKTNDTDIEEDDSIDFLGVEGAKNPIKEVNDVNIIDISDREDGEDGEDSAGTTVLQLSKIKKIFKTDPEHVSASEAAVFTTAIATELFIQYFTEQASLIARSEKRKKLQYKDFANAASAIEQLYFLSDIVPKTHNLKSLVENDKVKYAPRKKDVGLEKGQGTLNFGQKARSKQKAPISAPEDEEHKGEEEIEEEELPESDDDGDTGYKYAQNNSDDEVVDPIEEKSEGDQNTDEEQVRKDQDNDIIMD